MTRLTCLSMMFVVGCDSTPKPQSSKVAEPSVATPTRQIECAKISAEIRSKFFDTAISTQEAPVVIPNEGITTLCKFKLSASTTFVNFRCGPSFDNVEKYVESARRHTAQLGV